MYYTKAITLFLTFSIIIPLCCCWGTGALEFEKAAEEARDCCPITPSDADRNNQGNENDCDHKNLKKLLNEFLVIDKSQANLQSPVFAPVYKLSFNNQLAPTPVYTGRHLNSEPNAPPLLQVHCVYLL